jgi:hypothetical protein
MTAIDEKEGDMNERERESKKKQTQNSSSGRQYG